MKAAFESLQESGKVATRKIPSCRFLLTRSLALIPPIANVDSSISICCSISQKAFLAFPFHHRFRLLLVFFWSRRRWKKGKNEKNCDPDCHLSSILMLIPEHFKSSKRRGGWKRQKKKRSIATSLIYITYEVVRGNFPWQRGLPAIGTRRRAERPSRDF